MSNIAVCTFLRRSFSRSSCVAAVSLCLNPPPLQPPPPPPPPTPSVNKSPPPPIHNHNLKRLFLCDPPPHLLSSQVAKGKLTSEAELLTAGQMLSAPQVREEGVPAFETYTQTLKHLNSKLLQTSVEQNTHDQSSSHHRVCYSCPFLSSRHFSSPSAFALLLTILHCFLFLCG
jgi:hypothetical protein